MASLNEIFGKKGAKESFELSDLNDILGEKMPELPFNAVGRVRLLKALRNRFGEGYRNIAKLKGIIKQFDGEIKSDLDIRKIKSMKMED